MALSNERHTCMFFVLMPVKLLGHRCATEIGQTQTNAKPSEHTLGGMESQNDAAEFMQTVVRRLGTLPTKRTHIISWLSENIWL